jgi:hypothetical protein
VEILGAYVDKLIWIGAGIFAIYYSAKSREKLGKKKTTFLKCCGIALIVLGIGSFLLMER